MWRLLEPIAPAIPVEPAPFVMVAMMALFGSVAHAPLAVMLMVAEMTGNLSMLAPAMVAVGLATFVVGSRTIYRSQLATRADSPANRFRFALPLLASVPVLDAARQPRLVIGAGETAGMARARIQATNVPGAPVIGDDGSVLGMVDVASMGAVADDTLVGATDYLRGPILNADDGLDDALGALSDHRRTWAPVEADGRLAGVLSVRDIMAAYRTALDGNVRRVRGLRAGGVIIEARIARSSALAGRSVSEIPWPRNAVLVAVERDEVLVVPRGDLQLELGDYVSIFSAPESRAEVERLVEEETDPGEPDVKTEMLAHEVSA
jgi:CBS domain-containing protein